MMSNDINKVDFSFGWLALKLLGKSLYSNAWSAISELVANGFDAGAKNVFVYVDISNKNDAIIELFDDGSGMDSLGIETYAKVGYNKRLNPKKKSDDNYLTMGRKGIGKLAALYLSENYYLITKTVDEETKWKMVYQENTNDENEHPFLSRTHDDIDIKCIHRWRECSTGTLLRMNHVNLTGLGSVAFEALSKKLSNYFALDSMGKRCIYLCVNDSNNKIIDFKQIKKEIAFKNMAFISYCAEDKKSNILQIIENNKDNITKFPYNKLNGKQFYYHTLEANEFSNIEHLEVNGSIDCIDLTGRTVSKKYSLTGWVGLHATIDNDLAKEHDPLFSRNKFYNPIQLRLYIRNKLAIENFLNVIRNTQAFVNYIEGEIHFDILDEDDLPDIATSNRQGLDEHDPRVQLLDSLVRKIITDLINKRSALNDKIKKEEKKLVEKQNTSAKQQFSKEIEAEFEKFNVLTNGQKSELASIISNKIKGNVVPKNDYIVFISHSRVDKIITDFLYNLLRKRGAKSSEFFYTSRDDSVDQYQNTEALADQIKRNILNDNALLLYLTSKAYKNSEFCMFEGGAGWATRSVGENIIISLTYDEIPEFLTNGKLEFCLENNKKILLNRSTYLYIVEVLNLIIRHLNAGRRANAEVEICEFPKTEIPQEIELVEKNLNISDYMDEDIKKYWEFYVTKNLETYIHERYNDEKNSTSNNE